MKKDYGMPNKLFKVGPSCRDRASARTLEPRASGGVCGTQLHDQVRPDHRQLELLRDHVKARAFVEGAGRGARVAPDPLRAFGERVVHERLEYARARAYAACTGRRGHATYAPAAGLAVPRDQPDGDELLAEEGANRKSVTRLTASHRLDGFVRSQHRLAQLARALERDGPDVQIGHRREASRAHAGFALASTGRNQGDRDAHLQPPRPS